jgi:hypothetical protein
VDEEMVMARLTDLLCAGLLESVTVNVGELVIALAAGVPLIKPVAAFSDNPTGKEPLVMVQAYGTVPPLAIRVALYAAPTWPPGSDEVAMFRGVILAAVIVNARLTDLFCAGLLESVTVNVSAVAFAATVGVPLMTPVAALSDNPEGREPDVIVQV